MCSCGCQVCPWDTYPGVGRCLDMVVVVAVVASVAVRVEPWRVRSWVS